MPHLLDDRDIDRATRLDILETAWAIKHGGRDLGRPLEGKHLAIIMNKPSLRTRTSFTVAIRDLGAHTIEVGGHNTKLGKGEDMEEWAAVLGSMVDGLVARVFRHSELEELAKYGGVPVVNALCDQLHPCQGLADAFTVWEAAKKAGEPGAETAESFFSKPQIWAYLGDGNNVAHSLALTCASLGVIFRVATPASRECNPTLMAGARELHPGGASGIVESTDPQAVLDGARMLYTDVWVSMGEEGEKDAAAEAALYKGFQVDAAKMGRAADGAIFMHCLPAEPGKEVSAEVLRGPQSVILDQAENRLWTTKALLARYVYA